MYFEVAVDGGVRSKGWEPAKEAQWPSNSRLSSFGVDRLELGVKGSYAEEAEEKLVEVEGHDMPWLDKLKLSFMLNLKSESYCILGNGCVACTRVRVCVCVSRRVRAGVEGIKEGKLRNYPGKEWQSFFPRIILSTSVPIPRNKCCEGGNNLF
jgi:hypothetical protein